MTKLVKEYVQDKIQEGVAKKRAALHKEYEEARKATVEQEKIDEIVYASKEFKALEAFIRKWAENHGATVKSTGYKGGRLANTTFAVTFQRYTEARDKSAEFGYKVARVIRDTLVELELLKSKADVEKLIAKAVDTLNKTK